MNIQLKHLPLGVLFLVFFSIEILTSVPKAVLAGEVKPQPFGQNDEDKLFPYPIPSDLPIPEKSERLRRSFGSSTLNYTFGCTEGSSKVISFYRDQLPKLGWKTTVASASDNKSGPYQRLSGKKEEGGRQKSCSITIAPIDPGTTLTGGIDGTVSNPPFKSYVSIQYTDPTLVPKPVN